MAHASAALECPPGDFVAWGITFLNLSFSHARTKACRNVYQLRKHRVYFIAYSSMGWYQTMYNETCQIDYFLLDTSVWTCLNNMYCRCRNFVCGCHIVFAKNIFNMFLHTNLHAIFFYFLFTLRGRSQTTLANFRFFWPPTLLRWHFLWYKCWQKLDFFGPPTYLVLQT